MELRRSTDDKSIKSPQYIRGNWQIEKFCRAYQEELENQLTDVVMLDVSEVNKLNAQIKVNNMYNELCDVMHSATRKCCNQYLTTEKSHRKNWWNKDCLRARNRNRLFFCIWKSLGRPSQGEAYKCYMESRRAYRRVCRNAVNNKINNKFQLINKLYKQHNSKKLWNVIRRCKKSDTCTDAIDLNTLKDYFSNKFASASPNSFQKEADAEVTAHYERLCATPSSLIMTNYNVQKFIKLLKPGCTPGIDGITTEHLSNGLKTSLPLYLSTLFSVCLKYGIVPNDFCVGILVPVLKKNTLDPTVPKNYRPITISVIMSKILEHFILEKCGDDTYNEHQYGFISNRGTNMATAVAHDVSAYCAASGSPTFLCSLDAEGAFDNLPHSIMFKRAMNAIPDRCWQILFYWYKNMTFSLKWNGNITENIAIGRGTRQGGLTSPMIFNLFYKDLITELNNLDCGTRIGSQNYNIFAYADDILLISTTVTGLQTLIDSNLQTLICSEKYHNEWSMLQSQ